MVFRVRGQGSEVGGQGRAALRLLVILALAVTSGSSQNPPAAAAEPAATNLADLAGAKAIDMQASGATAQGFRAANDLPLETWATGAKRYGLYVPGRGWGLKDTAALGDDDGLVITGNGVGPLRAEDEYGVGLAGGAPSRLVATNNVLDWPLVSYAGDSLTLSGLMLQGRYARADVAELEGLDRRELLVDLDGRCLATNVGFSLGDVGVRLADGAEFHGVAIQFLETGAAFDFNGAATVRLTAGSGLGPASFTGTLGSAEDPARIVIAYQAIAGDVDELIAEDAAGVADVTITGVVDGAGAVVTRSYRFDDGVITPLDELTTAFDTSAELATILGDETGSAGGFVRATSPTLSGPVINSGLRLGGATIASPLDGQLWLDQATGELRAHVNDATVVIADGSEDASLAPLEEAVDVIEDRLGEPLDASTSSNGWQATGAPESEAAIDARTAALQASIDAAYAAGAEWSPPFPAGSVLEVSAPIELPTSDYTPGTTVFRPMRFDWKNICLVRADHWEAPSSIHTAMVVSAGYEWFVNNEPDAQWQQDGLPNNVELVNLRLDGNGAINDQPWQFNVGDQYEADGVAWFGVLQLDNLDATNMPGWVLRVTRGYNPHEGTFDPGDYEITDVGNIHFSKVLSGILVDTGDAETHGVIEGTLFAHVGLLANDTSFRCDTAHLYGGFADQPLDDVDAGGGFTLPKRYVGCAIVSGPNGPNYWGEIYPETARICFYADGGGDGGANNSTVERLTMRIINDDGDVGAKIDSKVRIGSINGDFSHGTAVELMTWSLGSNLEHVSLSLTEDATGILLRGHHNRIGSGMIGGGSTGYGCVFGDAESPDVSSPGNNVVDFAWGNLGGGMNVVAAGLNNRVRVYRYGGGGSNPSLSGITPGAPNTFEGLAE
jgi:hypothetical protein